MAKVIYNGDVTKRTNAYRLRKQGPGGEDIVLQLGQEQEVPDSAIETLREARGFYFEIDGQGGERDDAVPAPPPKLEDLTVNELEALAKERDVRVKRNASHEQLVAALTEAAEPTTPNAEDSADPEGVKPAAA